MSSWKRLKRYERLGNAIYWLCLIASVLLVTSGIMTVATLVGQITQTWTAFGKSALLAAAIYAVGWIVRTFTSLD